MTLLEAIPIYGAVVTTLTILAGSIKYVLSSKVKPIEDDIEHIEDKIKSLKEENKQQYDKIDTLKQTLVDDVKEISKGNFEFRLKYEKSISELRLLLSEKYVTKTECEKESESIKKRIDN